MRNASALIQNAKVDTQMSDHMNILSDFHLKNPPVPKKEVVLRKLNSIDKEEFKHDIRNKVCGIQLESLCAALVKVYNSVLRELLEKHATEQHCIIYLRPNAKWMTEDIKEEKRTRSQREKRWRRTRLVIDLEIFKSQRLKVRILVENTKTSFYSKLVLQNSTSPKDIFCIINFLLHRNPE